MQDTDKKTINLWVAFADTDYPAFQRLCDAFEREFWNSKFDPNILNEGWDLNIILRNPDDNKDILTTTMRKADYVLACLTPALNEENLISQLRRAHSLKKEIIVFYYGRLCDINCKTISPKFSADLFLVLQGSKQVALWGSPTSELEAIFSNIEPSWTKKKDSIVFISHNHKDYQLAKIIYDYLSKSGINAFLSEVALPSLGSSDYMKEIDLALERSQHMIVNGLSPADLPMSLRYYEVINNAEEGIERLNKYII
jgi:hypothetical protein